MERRGTPFTRQSLVVELDTLAHAVGKIFLRDGYLSPAGILLRADQEVVTLGLGKSRAERKREWERMRSLMQREHLVPCIAWEAWLVAVDAARTSPGALRSIEPSRHPDRKEYVMIQGESDFGCFNWRAEILRDRHGHPRLAPWVKDGFEDDLEMALFPGG